MNTQLTLDIRRASYALGGAVLLLLTALTAITLLLARDSKARLEPLHERVEALSYAQEQLLDHLVVEQKWLDLRTGARAEATDAEIERRDSVLRAMDAVVQEVDSTLESLGTAQSDFRHVTALAAVGITLLVLVVVALTMVARERIIKPLGKLADRLGGLAREDYRPERLDDVDDVVRPAFASYNRLVSRLARLGKAHRARHQRMESQVNEAAGVLVAQRAELARAERLAAIGEMAASVAHEVRNPLAAIRAACRSLIEDVGEEDIRQRLRMIEEEVNRLVEIVNRQLRSARHRPEEPQPTDISDLVRNLMQLMEYQIPDTVALRTTLPSKLLAHLRPNGLRQALLNLIKNSLDALRGRDGVIVITAFKGRDGIEIRVEDTGPGFPEGVLGKSVHRFVTGKRDGTGLGLAVVDRYVRDQGGKLKIDNRSEGGARVRIILPLQSKAEVRAART